MGRMSVELVPRSWSELKVEFNKIQSEFKEFDSVNIPDLLRFDIRSWEACAEAKKHFKTAVPHIRAMDIDMKKPLPMAEFLIENGTEEVLVLTGDPPQDFNRKIYTSTSVDVIRKFQRELPNIKVYAAIDQYRSGVRTELEYVQRKEDAGAVGFYTQPFFDERYLEFYEEMLDGYKVFWGITPILNHNSLRYWEVKNRAIFPRGFEPDWNTNIEVARKIIKKVNEIDGDIYLMPIRTNIEAYINGVLGY